MFHSDQLKLSRGFDVSERCPDMFRSYLDKTGGQRDGGDRSLDQQRARPDCMRASHDMFARCLDNNDRCPGKQQAVRLKTRTVQGKTPAVAVVAQTYPDQQRAGQGRALPSHDIYDRCPDNNDRCPGKQRAVRLNTPAVRGKTPAATAAAQKYRDKNADDLDDTETIRPVSAK
jgi:hypothetical protein